MTETEPSPALKEKGKKKKKGQSVLDLPDVPQGQLPPHLELQRTRVVLDKDAPIYTNSVQFSGAYAAQGVDNSLRFSEFAKGLRVEVRSLSDEEMEFDLVGIDAAVANAFRRILIAEVATMAIEKVYVANNTSIVQDEVLAHRLGLVPLRIDPRLFDYRASEEAANEKNTVVFGMHVKCTKQGDRLVNDSALSGALKWLPGGSQWPPNDAKKFTSFAGEQVDAVPALRERPPAPTYVDIVLSRMRAGQEIELEAHAVKGLGKTHAKWSPVATARYKMLPEVVFKKPVEGEFAEELVKRCPVNVFDIEDMGGVKRAVASRPRDCTACRECVRDEGWDEFVQLRRVKDHFIFNIESTGALPPDVLFVEAINVLQQKALNIATELSK